MKWLLRLFQHRFRISAIFRRRRRVSTKLTPRYEARRVRELRAARERFEAMA